MVHLYRLICALLLAASCSVAVADGGPFPPIVEEPTGNCTPANFPRGYTSDASVSGSWSCGGPFGPSTNCGWIYTSPKYGWDGTLQNGLVDGMCNKPPPVYSCPPGATASGSGAATVCTCTAGLRPFNGQCIALPSCPEGQHEEGGACVPDKCKPNEIRVNGVCVKEPDCPEGEVRVAGQCKKPDKCPKPGTLAGEYRMSNATPTSMCEGGCTVSISSFVRATKDGKVVETVGIGYYTGGECNGPDNPPNDDDEGGGNGEPGGGNNGGGDGGGNNGGGSNGGGTNGGGNNGGGDGPERCPNGKCSGDGQGGDDNDKPKNPDSNGTCPSDTYKSNGKCYPKEPRPPKPPDDDGKCPPGYIKAGTQCLWLEPKPDDEADEPSLFSGSCGAFTCQGDAIQCAIAREQHIRSCKLFDDKSAESELYEANKGKTGNQTGELPGNETISLTGRIDTTDLLGGGGCFGDLSVTVWGRGVSLPLSDLCQYLAMLGNILVAVSMLMAARIVTRG